MTTETLPTSHTGTHEPVAGAMKICHVAVVNSQLQSLAVEETAEGWLLPVHAFPPHSSQQFILQRSMRSLPIAAIPRCLAFSKVDPATHSIDYALIADATCATLSIQPPFRMVSLDSLAGMRAVLPYQASVVRQLND